MRIGGSETGTAGYRGAQSGGDVKSREDWSESRLASVCLSSAPLYSTLALQRRAGAKSHETLGTGS
jgi:hypothetical protein